MDMKIKHTAGILFTTIFFVLLYSCEEMETAKPYIPLSNHEEYDLYDYYIDEYDNEGIVVLVQEFKNRPSYIIVMSLDESYEYWGPLGTIVNKDNEINDYLLLGVIMHQGMSYIGIDSFPAQDWCHKKNKNEKYPWAGSWRLPTDYELGRAITVPFYGNLIQLNEAIERYGGVPIDKTKPYWTCTEDYDRTQETAGESVTIYDPANRALVVAADYTLYNDKKEWLKSKKHYVRAIKYVYYKQD